MVPVFNGLRVTDSTYEAMASHSLSLQALAALRESLGCNQNFEMGCPSLAALATSSSRGRVNNTVAPVCVAHTFGH